MEKDVEATPESPNGGAEARQGQVEFPRARTAFGRFIDGFKRNPNARVTVQAIDASGRVLENQPPAEPAPAMRLKQRHLQMIAIGGSIGSGLFIGSGSALASDGPASPVIAYDLISISLYCTVHALGELAVQYPVAGAFSVYASRFVDEAWGFAMGWNYALQWAITLALEIVAASLILVFWPGSRGVNGAAWVTIFLVVIIAINFFGVRGYGEAEFIFSIIKVLAVIGFIILGIVINTGGVGNQGYIGADYWHEPGAFNHGFKGLCSVFVTAAFSFSGTELVGLAAAETENPRLALPTAVKQVFWRIALFYIVSLALVGVLVPYDDPSLLDGTSSSDANASPFIIAVRNAGIDALPSIINVVILIAILSVGNASVYGASRTLAALVDMGQAPPILSYVDQEGRPLVAIIVTSSFGFLCYLMAAGPDTTTQAFNWMLAISGLATVFVWGTICLCHIRFRRAWRMVGHTLDELAFKSQATVYGSWLGLIMNCLILAAQFFTGVAPVGHGSQSASELAKGFFEVYLAAPVVLVMYVGYKLWFKTKIRKFEEIDITSGRREVENLQEILAEERSIRKSWPWWKKIWKFLR